MKYSKPFLLTAFAASMLTSCQDKQPVAAANEKHINAIDTVDFIGFKRFKDNHTRTPHIATFYIDETQTSSVPQKFSQQKFTLPESALHPRYQSNPNNEPLTKTVDSGFRVFIKPQ